MYRLNLNLLNLLTGVLLLSVSHLTLANQASSADEANLLTLAKSIVKSDAQINQERESLFKLELGEQRNLFAKSESRLAVAELEQARLKKLFDENEKELAELEQKLSRRSGALGEVFGVAKESALELVPMLQDSLTSADYPSRITSLEFAESKRVPTIADFDALMTQLKLEMKATGQVATFSTNVIDDQGQESEQRVRRFGVFSSVNDEGQYLKWDVASQALKQLPVQPDHSVAFDSNSDTTVVLLDPLRGERFALLDREPTLVERIEQGGAVGYLILSLGLLGVIVAIFQMIRLLITELGVRQQLASELGPDKSNPLGRVLASITEEGRKVDGQYDASLEVKVDEAILKELPKIEQGQSFLKLLAAVAPLLGLLGTVVGMIATFQSITLFGTSDPKLMANGISQALMTTVFGLVVAVPILFCHSVLVARGSRLVQILQEKSLGVLAANSEQQERVVSNELHVA